MFKKLFVGVGLLTILTGCSGGGVVSLPTESYVSSIFSIDKPLEWDVLEGGDFTSNVPLQALVSFKDNVGHELFVANVSVLAEAVGEGFIQADYTNSQRAKNKESLLGYQELSVSALEIDQGKSTVEADLVRFQGKREVKDPLVEFEQLTVVSGGVAYMVLGAYIPADNVSKVATVREMVRSFVLR
ncbi:hypothetical protein CVV38_03510 [Candidatus Peregrinibacteria bacterium HGW-Peregrinibacteria-1]|nr:MAG: hypothetical protein CVV38_03510 [Candidatus Peregrinibacteria bacterium HGW-Peregrinibacteria-1]